MEEEHLHESNRRILTVYSINGKELCWFDAQEILAEGRDITKTHLYFTLMERYLYNLKQKVLDPFLTNNNFRLAIKDYDTKTFKTYDRRIQEDVTFLINNLVKKYRYTPKGAREVCIYVVDNDLAKKFSKP